MMYGLLWKTHQLAPAMQLTSHFEACVEPMSGKPEVGTGPYTEQCINLFMLNKINIIHTF